MDHNSLYAPQEHRQVHSFNTGSRRLGASPRTSDISHMEERPRPVEPHPNSAGTMAPIATTGTENLDTFSDYQSMGAPTLSSTSNVNSVRNGAPFALLDWYRNDGPWDPLVGKNTPPLRQEDSRSRAGHMSAPLKHTGPTFQGYRANTVPSECDTLHTGVLPSDSGYGSGPRPSIGNPSVYDDVVDHNTETQSLMDTFGDLNFTINPLVHPPMDQDSHNLTCAWCHQKVKTKSELNKHKQRHTKPHHCSHPGCPRTDGFSTKNDLDRHTRSRHPRETATGNRYLCRIGACKNKEKIWPRADNFRQHLKRVHKQVVSADDDLDGYLYREQPSVRATDLVGMGSSVTSFTMGPNPDSQAMTSPSFLLERSGLSSPLRGYSDTYGGVLMEDPLHYEETSDLGQAPQYSMLTSSDSPDELHQQSIEPLDFGLDDSDDQEDPSPEQCVDRTESGNTAYIHPDILKQDLSPAEGQAQDVAEAKSRDHQRPDKADCRVQHNSTQAVNEAGTGADQVPVVGASRDNAISVDDQDAPADELSPRSRASSPEFKHEASDQKDATSSQVKSDSTGPSESMDLDDEDKATAMLKDLHQKGLLAKLVGELGFQKRPLTTKSKKAVSSPSMTQETCNVTCEAPGCNKSFVRRCELKKHMKRHEKPYGCTYPSCSKKFGSKNDWKRHENSQHFQLEVWKCNEKLKESDSVCGKACHRRETFKYHLQKEHEISEQRIIEQKWEDCRVGRNCETRFWCGFCKKIIEIREKGLEAWTERFNHIDDHFSGRVGAKMDIEQWKCVDPDLPEIVFSPRSDDDSEDSSPKPATPASADHAAVEPDEKPQASKKRKLADEDSGPSKRQALDTFVWYCVSFKPPIQQRSCTNYKQCKCRNQVGSVAVSAACMEPYCEHQRCNECTVEGTS